MIVCKVFLTGGDIVFVFVVDSVLRSSPTSKIFSEISSYLLISKCLLDGTKSVASVFGVGCSFLMNFVKAEKRLFDF